MKVHTEHMFRLWVRCVGICAAWPKTMKCHEAKEKNNFCRLCLFSAIKLQLFDKLKVVTSEKIGGSGVGCPSKLVSIRNNRNWNRNQFRHYPKQNVCFGCFASIAKQRVSVFR